MKLTALRYYHLLRRVQCVENSLIINIFFFFLNSFCRNVKVVGMVVNGLSFCSSIDPSMLGINTFFAYQ